jgi:hypothetical protein
MVLIILDNFNVGNLRVDAARNEIPQEVANRLASSCRQVSRQRRYSEINDGGSNGNWKDVKGNAGNSPN